MHLLINKASLLKALSHQQSLIERRGPSPILSHVKLDAQGHELIFTGTDLESTLKEQVEADILEEGSLTVSAHMFYDIVRKMPDGLITLSYGEGKSDFMGQKDQKSKEQFHGAGAMTMGPLGEESSSSSSLSTFPLKISGPDIDFSLPTLPSADFPALHHGGDYKEFSLPIPIMKRLLEDTKFAMSSEETRYALNGIYFHGYEDQWRAVATDARLLALSWIPLDTQEVLSNLSGFIVGRKAIGEINKILDGQEGDLHLEISKNYLRCTLHHVSFSSRLIDGQFPDYNVALPDNNPYKMTLKVKAFEEAITRVSMVSFDKQRLVRLSLGDNTLILSACSPQYGSALEKITVEYQDGALNLGFNPKHLLDICSHMTGETLVLEMKNSTSPVLFRDPSNPYLRFVLMPLRT